jgi:hypothetical protein
VSKKRKIRKMRTTARKNPNGSTSSHLMAHEGDMSKKRKGNFRVFPTVAPKEGKENSTDFHDWIVQDEFTAGKNDEVIHVNSKRKAEKLAGGSWKKGRDKKEAMKAYRKNKKK